MRYTYLLLFLWLSWSSSQKVDEEEAKRLAGLFGPATPDAPLDLTPTRGKVTKPPKGDEISAEERKRLEELFGKDDDGPTLSPRDNTEDQPECETPEGKSGVCVPYYQCTRDGTVIDDGATLIDIRQRDCSHYLEVCCLLGQTKDKPPPPVVDETECGWSNPGAQSFRIVSDDNSTAEFGDFPWMVAILKRSEPNAPWSQGDYVGGGSIIHPSVVLTAYHKVTGKAASELKCRAGEWDTQTDKEIYPHQERNVKKIIKHPDYYRPSVYNSIALLILEAPYELTNAPHIGVACVAPQPPPAGTRCQSMGWGKEFNDKDKYAVVLKKVELPALSRDACQKEFRKTRLGAYFTLHPSLMCAGGEAGRDTCQGDGGSPLVCPIGNIDPKKEPPRYAIAGMVAWGLGCGDPVPAAYVNVPHFYDWLGAQMKAEGFGTSSYTYKS